ncbi:MAG: sulfatase-like hydrolase/transferase [Lachnospiraceae bacterium]|nr:sulfatase-like hydrolase/transferase [Lachnospiraceae bacterium]
MKKIFQKAATLTTPLKNKITAYKTREKKPHPHVEKAVKIMNQFSVLFHALLACTLVFVIESLSRHSVFSAFAFIGKHTWAYLYNSFIVFASLSIVYLARRRVLTRIVISFFWLFLGLINGVVLSNRVTPFGFTDLKCISDLFAMQNTQYFTAKEATAVVIFVVIFLLFCICLFLYGPKFQGKMHRLYSLLLVIATASLLPLTTKAAQSSNVVDSYFSNIAQGYEDYGFIYGFSSSVVDRGMNQPRSYSEEHIHTIEAQVSSSISETPAAATTYADAETPNMIVILLESFIDPYEVDYLELSEDPIPNFRSLSENYSSGYLTVPVVGAGTSNTEFEVLTGMSMRYFGTGEYPHKTILKQTDCESIASDLSAIGYGTHVVHNNGGNFYSRANAFSMMGFDTFTSKECINIQEYTPLGSWPTDDILISETMKALDATPDQADLVYTITVQGHGNYPTEKILENPEILVTGAPTEEQNNQWEYYVNMIHEVDKFIANLTAELEARDEDTIVVMFGDHLPTMGLADENMASGSIFKTKYATWNNFDLPKRDADLAAYQLLADITDQLNIHTGTMFTYTQSRRNSQDYYDGLENLQYDLLYGKRFAYDGTDKYPATDLVMGIDEVSITRVWKTSDNKLCIYGENFTPWTKIFVNGEKVSTTFVSGTMLRISADQLENGDILTANIMGSGNTIFRSSNDYSYTKAETTPSNE